MTSDLPIAEQIAAVREPGWYWVRVIADGPWRPYQWYGSRGGEIFWAMLRYDEPAEIGPRIPDPATLQQHERDREKVAAMMMRNSIATGHGDTIDDLLSELEAAVQRDREAYNANVDLLKACEHIACGDDGWQILRNECPSTAAVAALRDAWARDRERCERAMTALRFYADERRYDYDETCSPTGRNPAGGDVLSDNGERAREAIAALDAAAPDSAYNTT